MKVEFRVLALAALTQIGLAQSVTAQSYVGPFVPHRGQQITTAFTNDFGRDADSTTVIADVNSEVVSLDYFSTRGIATRRDILIADRQTAMAYVLGYAPRMPAMIPGTTSLGISGAALSQLRSTGNVPLTFVYSEGLDRIECFLQLVAVDVKKPVLVEDRIFDVPTVHARGNCGSGSRTGSGSFYFANDANNPILIESIIEFSWESRPRTERITRVAAGPGMHSEMEQSLNTLGAYDVYGLHFDFDRASLRADTAQLVREIAQMLKSNAHWTLMIAGHTDSTGGADYNMRLSTDRAESVRQALIAEGVEAGRLQSTGYGETRPKADNDSLYGRAMNRRVEFRRLDR